MTRILLLDNFENIKKAKMKTLAIIILIGILPFIGNTQSNPRTSHPDAIVLSVGGPGLYGSLSYEHFISPSTNIELGSGPYTAFAGIKYHIGGNEDKQWTPYIGGYGIYLWIFEIFDDDDEVSPFAAYIPIGIQYTGNGKVSFAIEVAALAGAGEVLPFGSLKLGYRL